MRDIKDGHYIHHYIKSDSPGTSPTRISRLAQELSDLSNALPIDSTNAIFVRADKEKVYLIKALVMGSAGTPYAHGAFEFDLYWNWNYPRDPPKMNLMTTGGQAVRFNPNLYACGKVCLSLLGTWRGNATENWDPRISTILQVLMSTQAIVMSEEVYFNEPGFEGEAGTPDGERKNEGYSNIVKYWNIKYAMIEQIRNPPRGFETVIKTHFYLKREEIMKDARKWIDEATANEALYTGLVSDHNYNWWNKFKNKGTYLKMLTEIVNELEKELNQLQDPAGDNQSLTQAKSKRKNKVINKDISEGAGLLSNGDSDEEETIVVTGGINVEKEDVTDLFSRYIGALGIEVVAKQAESHIFLSGAEIAIAMNLVMAGWKTFTLHDIKNVTTNDLSSQFFLHHDDLGKNRAECHIKKLQQLNGYVKCIWKTFELLTTGETLEQAGF